MVGVSVEGQGEGERQSERAALPHMFDRSVLRAVLTRKEKGNPTPSQSGSSQNAKPTWIYWWELQETMETTSPKPLLEANLHPTPKLHWPRTQTPSNSESTQNPQLLNL